MIAFFDANALIYLVEGREPFVKRVRQKLAMIATAHPQLGAALSRLSWLACRVGPMRSNDRVLLAAYDAFFGRSDLVWVDLSRDVVELAAAIQAKHRLRTPDCLQAASCLQLGDQHVFLTGDAQFLRVAGLHVQLLS